MLLFSVPSQGKIIYINSSVQYCSIVTVFGNNVTTLRRTGFGDKLIFKQIDFFLFYYYYYYSGEKGFEAFTNNKHGGDYKVLLCCYLWEKK